MDEEAETKAIEKWLRMVDKPVENILKKRVRASFEYLRNQEPTYTPTPEFLKKLIQEYPTVFRPVSIKNHGPGITLVEEEANDDQQTA